MNNTYINRDLAMCPVNDFIRNVQPKLSDNCVAEEDYKNSILVGWKIVKL